MNIDLLRHGTLAQMAGAWSQVVHHDISTLLEERFKSVFMYFIAYTGVPFGESDLIIEGRQIIPLALHKAVFLRNGFDAVRRGVNFLDRDWNHNRVRCARTTSGLPSASI